MLYYTLYQVLILIKEFDKQLRQKFVYIAIFIVIQLFSLILII